MNPREPEIAMSHSAALPFTLRRSSDVISAGSVTSTTERVHGLLRLDGDRLRIQWRVARTIDRIGGEIRTDEELEAVRKVGEGAGAALPSPGGAPVEESGR